VKPETSVKVDKYILEKYFFDGEEELHLARIVMHEGIGLRGEEYYDGGWHPFPGALSYMTDPSPGEFIDEEEAAAVMERIDREG
jgi:hypothetical protein